MIDVEQLARFMFDRQATSYDATPVERELAWAMPQVRAFWMDEAGAVAAFLKLGAQT